MIPSTDMDFKNQFIVFLGVLYVLKLIYKSLLQVNKIIISVLVSNGDLKTFFGEWAVIFGMRNEFGVTLTNELAKKGINIAIIDSKEEMIKIAPQLRKDYSIQVKVVEVDFNSGKGIYGDLKKYLHGINIGILVNNISSAPISQDLFIEQPEEYLWELIDTNMIATAIVYRTLVPKMKENRKGAIVNLISPSHDSINTYSATEAFREFMINSMKYEYDDFNLTVTNIKNNFLNSRKNRKSSESIRKLLNSYKFGLYTMDDF